MANELKLGNWREKTIRGRDKNTVWIERRKYRYKKIGDYRVEEGIITEHLEKGYGEKEFSKKYNQHLVGYHYLSLINPDNSDQFWIQNVGKRWAFFRDLPTNCRYYKNFETALKRFNRELEKELGIIVIR